MNEAMTDPNNPEQQTPPTRRRGALFVRSVGFVLMGVAILIIFYGLVGLYAWRQGVQERTDTLAAEHTADLARQLELAQVDIDAGRYELAIRRTDYILADDPSNLEAAALQNEANQLWAILLTPSPTVTPTPLPPTVTPTPSATPIPTIDPSNLGRELDDIQINVDNQEWETAVSKLETFRQSYPDYEPLRTAQMLYDSYVGLGLRFTRSDKGQIERGLVYLAQAETLGTLSEEVAGEVFWAEQYLEGIVYDGINWDAYLSYFRPMCQFAPLFQNSCGKLAKGLVAKGSQLTSVLDWCPAVDVYVEVQPYLRYLDEDDPIRFDFSLRLSTAQNMCLSATATPISPDIITNTFPITGSTGTGGDTIFFGEITPTPTPQPSGAVPVGLTTNTDD